MASALVSASPEAGCMRWCQLAGCCCTRLSATLPPRGHQPNPPDAFWAGVLPSTKLAVRASYRPNHTAGVGTHLRPGAAPATTASHRVLPCERSEVRREKIEAVANKALRAGASTRGGSGGGNADSMLPYIPIPMPGAPETPVRDCALKKMSQGNRLSTRCPKSARAAARCVPIATFASATQREHVANLYIYIYISTVTRA